MFEKIPKAQTPSFSPALSVCVGAGLDTEVEIDDVAVRAFYSLENEKKWFTLFSEDFGRLKEKNDLAGSG